MYHNITVADVNYDYLPDLYITGAQSGAYGKLFVNNMPEPFSEQAQSYNLQQITDISAAFFQMTRTSGLSVLAGRRLMEMQYNRFVDITSGSGLEGLSNVLTPVFFDIDGDIDDDLFIAGNWELNSGTLFRNMGNGTFVDISDNTDRGGFGYGQEVTFGDIDNDGDFDIYLCSGFGTNSMWENDGDGYFTNITASSHTGCDGYSRGANFGDFDNDCDLDLFVNRASATKMLYLNNGNGVFADASEESGVAVNGGGFGCAISDIDGDGQLDIIAANSDYVRNQIFINDNSNGSFIKVKVIGRAPNTLALGAIIELYDYGDQIADNTLIGKREISSHPSFYCVNDLTAHFGTGEYADLMVSIRFQSGAIKDTSGFLPGETIILREPDPTSVNQPETNLPKQYMTLSAYPNPFNNNCAITFDGDGSSDYKITIYDLLGRQIQQADIRDRSDSRIRYIWNGSNYDGLPVPSGVYYLRVQSEYSSVGQKITLLK